MISTEYSKLHKEIISLKNNGFSCRRIARTLNTYCDRVVGILREHGFEIFPNKKYTYFQDVFECIDTEHKAYWLGFLFADGDVRIGKWRLKLCLSIKDEFHLVKFSNFIGLKLPIEISKQRNNKKYVTVSVNSKKIVSDLILLGCTPRKSKTLLFPKLRQDLIRHFIRGYFDGDGWATIENKADRLRIGFLGTMLFLNEVLDNIILNTGMNKVKIIPKSGIYMLSLGHKKYNLKLYEYFYKDASIFLERKYKVFTKGL